MQVQTNARLVRYEADKTGIRRDVEVTTLEDLGRYLRNLRESRRLTQTSLSAKTEAMAGRKISRSRISEIENAKRDPLSERELRVYMVGLKRTPYHIDQMVETLRQCTMTPPNESPADPVLTSSAIPDPYPAGLGGAKDDLALWKESSKDESTVAGQEEEGRKRWPREDTSIPLLDTSQPQPSRRCGQRHRIALAVLVVVVLTGLGTELFLRRESADLLTSPGSPTALLTAPNAPHILEDTRDLIKNATVPDSALAPVNKGPTQTSKIKNRPNSEDTASRDITKRLVGHCCVHERQGQKVDIAAFPDVKSDWHSYAERVIDGWRPNLGYEQLMKDTER